MKVTDKFFEKEFAIDAEDPYLLSLKIIDRMRDFYGVSEKRNEYKTDGLEHISNVEFIISKEADDYAHIKMEFRLHGEGKKLDVRIIGAIVLVLDNFGFFSESFMEFYIEKLYEDTKKKCEKTVDEIKKRFDKILETA